MFAGGAMTGIEVAEGRSFFDFYQNQQGVSELILIESGLNRFIRANF